MGEEYTSGKLAAVRNPDGIWINTSLFREAGDYFMKHGYYCSDKWGTTSWFDYWKEQRRRCIEGYSVGGARITGDHYYYLNFCPILKVDDITKKKSKKIKGFPDFWDGDYNYFWVRNIAKEGILTATLNDEEERERILHFDNLQQAKELKALFESLHLEVKIQVDYLKGGWNLIVGKARRKGYSYKSAAIGSNNYFTKPNSLTIFGAYDKKYLYPKGIFSMAMDNIYFTNDNTAWVMPSDVVNKPNAGHIKASYIQYKNGIKLEKGFMSEILALTFMDNPDAGRGKDAEDVFMEESGAFGTPGLLKRSYAALQDVVEAGAIKTGMITIFGTSGDMDSGSVDYADMHSRPEAFGLLPFDNIWDKNAGTQKVGFFHPVNWNMEGFYDKQGNSDKENAKQAELEIRKKLIQTGATSIDIQRRMQEKPLNPSEAFGNVSVNNFPVVELKEQLRKVIANDWQNTKGTPVKMYYEEGKVIAKPYLRGERTPITSYYNLPKDLRGCPVIYEYPVPNAPKGLYKIGYDPIRQDFGTSLAAIIVYKSVHKNTQYHDIIVAEYIGRMELADDNDRVAEMLADFYNTTIMHENEVPGVKNYFRRIKRLDLLAAQPDAVISKNIKSSKVARVYGCHMVTPLKDAGERYVKDWLLTTLDYDENGNPVTVIDRIYSRRLLEELISYNRKGNFDLVSALFMSMFQVQEEGLGKEYEENQQSKNAKKLLAMMENMYKKN